MIEAATIAIASLIQVVCIEAMALGDFGSGVMP
jgi:hypothetical protein